MRIFLHIGVEACGAGRIQETLSDKREQLARKGILYSNAAGRRNHTRLYMAVTDAGHVDPLRAARGAAGADAQAALREGLARDLAAEVARVRPETLILSASQLSASLFRASELARLHALLAPLSGDIRVIAHVDEQARVLTRHYAEQLFHGRTAPLSREVELARSGRPWREACLRGWGEGDPALNGFSEIQALPFWLDYEAMRDAWEGVFGTGSVALRPYDPALFAAPGLTAEIAAAFELPASIGKAPQGVETAAPSAAWLARSRALNADLTRLLGKGRIIPRNLWRRLVGETEIDGPPVAPGALSAVSDAFRDGNQRLASAFPALGDALMPDAPLADWAEAEPGGGFRATQYVAAFLPRIDSATKKEKRAHRAAGRTPETADAGPKAPPRPARANGEEALSPLLPPDARENYHKLKGGPFAPHNRLGLVNESELAAAFPEMPMRELQGGSSGNVIVGCMKNEAPYILEWIAYHRAIGVDNFLIYTNDCEDGTDEILGRLQQLGIVQHRNNDNWKGNSPQQHALNRSLKEELVRNAEWIIHIDVDEFINIRCGDGRLQDFFDAVPDATNVAMTWRLFGHNGIHAFRDELVIDQFDTCAPKYCPKPHTVWGFKTMFRNIGAYQKISCHRPNKLNEDFRDKVTWVNGSGRPMKGVHDNGWRSSKASIGYDLIQLNHYALRSAESFLIKRQRGRALHVDRTIGLNYWVRMDWDGQRDLTIKRNIPRTRAEIARLKADARLAKLHDAAVAWHRDKAAGLQAQPEFRELYDQAIATRLTELERVAFALALEVDS